MPEMDGIQLCEKLKTDERTSHIPVILLTSRSEIENKIKGLETGADDYITKPFSIAELKARVSNLINQRKRLRKKYKKRLNLEPKETASKSIDEKFLERVIKSLNAVLLILNFQLMSLQKKSD